MSNGIPKFHLLMTSLVKILKAQNPDIVFLYNVEPATLDHLRKSLSNFKFIYEFNNQMRYIPRPCKRQHEFYLLRFKKNYHYKRNVVEHFRVL